MPFENYFVRISCALLETESRKFLDLGICPEVYLDSCSLNTLSAEKIKSILEKFSSNTVHAPFLDISTGGYDDDIRELSYKKLSRVIDLAKEWGSALVVVHYNYDRLYYRQSIGGWLERSTEFFRRLTSVPGLPLIALENIDDPTPEVALELIRRVGHDQMVHCFDYGHHHVFGKMDSSEWLNRISNGKFVHFHFHDNEGSADDHLPMGEGTIDWQRAKRDIAGAGFDFSVTLEPHSEGDMLRSIEYYRANFLPAGG